MTEKPKPYQTTMKYLQKHELDIQETRRCLLKMYHSYIQTHAGYSIGIIIGSLTLFSRLDIFFAKDAVFPYSGLVFLVLLWLIIVASTWTILRILYWTSYANVALALDTNGIKNFFNSKNNRHARDRLSYYPEKLTPPTTAIIQWAIDEVHDHPIGEGTLGWEKRLALNTGRNKSLMVFVFIAVSILIILLVSVLIILLVVGLLL